MSIIIILPVTPFDKPILLVGFDLDKFLGELGDLSFCSPLFTDN